MIDHKQIMKNMIFNSLDRIEDRLGVMAHEIPELKDKLEKWQDGIIRDAFFNEYLNKFIDNLNN